MQCLAHGEGVWGVHSAAPECDPAHRVHASLVWGSMWFSQQGCGPGFVDSHTVARPRDIRTSGLPPFHCGH